MVTNWQAHLMSTYTVWPDWKIQVLKLLYSGEKLVVLLNNTATGEGGWVCNVQRIAGPSFPEARRLPFNTLLYCYK